MSQDFLESVVALKNVMYEGIELHVQKQRVLNHPQLPQEAIDIRNQFKLMGRLHQLHGEQRACVAFDWMYGNNLLPDSLPMDYKTITKELSFINGKRVDRAIVHKSGQLSIIEIKDDCDSRGIVAGIGQALYYTALAEKQYSESPIVPYLVVLGDHNADVARACSRGGVEYIPLGNIKFLTTISKIADFMAEI